MRVFSAVLEVFSRRGPIDLDEPPAAGEAHAITSALIADLRRTTPPKQVRRESTRQYLEAVIQRDHLEEYCQILTAAFGEPCKPFGVRARFSRPLEERIAALGGIMKKQCLYLRRFEDDRVAYAALWPWDDPNSITLKLGVFDEPLPATGTPTPPR